MFFDIVQNDKLENGTYSSIFYKIKLSEELINKYSELVQVSKNVYIVGYLNNYEKDGKKVYYIYPKEIKELDEKYKSKENNSVIGVDSDGVETWNGVRCEEKIATKEEQEELEKILNECCHC